VYLFVYRAILSKVELSRLERMAGTTRLELVTSAVTVAYQPLAHTESVGYACGSRQPLDLSGYAGSFLCNDLCNADDYFCVHESFAHASFSH